MELIKNITTISVLISSLLFQFLITAIILSMIKESKQRNAEKDLSD